MTVEARMGIEFRLLGPVGAWRDGREVALPGGRQRAVLAMLVLAANRTVTREALVDGVWGERSPAQVGHTLEVYVSRLRKALAQGGVAVEARDGGYRLCVAAASIDLFRFEAKITAATEVAGRGDDHGVRELLADALGMWHGEALSGLSDFPFARVEAARLAELRLGAVEDRIEVDLRLGRHASVVAELQALVAVHPERERPRRLLMLALYRCGRQQEALAVYAAAVADLREQFGLDPSRDLRRLQRQILAQDPELAAPSSSDRAIVTATAAAGRLAARRRGRRLVVVGLVGVLGVVATVAAVITTHGHAVAGARASTAPIAAYGITTIEPDGHPATVVDVGGPVRALASGFDAVWAAVSGVDVVVRVDPQTPRVAQTVPVDAPTALATGFGSVWVVSRAAGTVSEIDPATNMVRRVVSVGADPTGVVTGFGAVWVTEARPSTLSGELVRIDPRSDAETATPLAAAPSGVVAAASSLWISQAQAGTVSRVDPRHPSHVADTFSVGEAPGPIVSFGGSVWVANVDDGTVSQIDPTENRVIHTYSVGEQPQALAGAEGHVWVANALSATISSIDPGTRSVATYRTGGQPDAVAPGGSPWVGNAASAVENRGGTLRVWLQKGVSVDPASGDSFLVTPYSNDGLVAYRHVSGAAGTSLTPDLATALPRPTDHGLIYRFRLRAGLRYSDGRPVRASDERYALERAFRLRDFQIRDQPGLYAAKGDFDALEGSRRCQSRPATCSLHGGVVTNDVERTITFHLAHPDPDFLYKLTQPEASLLPPLPQLKRLGVVPATGPYMVERAGNRRIVLVRNPYFHSWSSQAHPPAFPDRIVLTRYATPLGVLRGENADVFPVEQVTSNLAALARAHPHQVVSSSAAGHWWMALNTRIPPFNNLFARRAVNLAVDRHALESAVVGGTTFWHPDCHVIPYQTLPYQPPCPYHAPNLARAKHLVTASGTAGTHITVWSFGPWYGGFATYFTHLLNQIGYHATPKIIPGGPDGPYFSKVSNSLTRAQISLDTWWEGFPLGSQFIGRFFTCKSFIPANPDNLNQSAFCDPTLDRKIYGANRTENGDPYTVAHTWARIDNAVMGQAPIVPSLSPNAVTLLSPRVKNPQTSWLGPLLLDQLWVK